jgi:DNA topoisomerase-1
VTGKSILPPPRQLARRAHLRYTSDQQPGVRRVGKPPRFRYRDENGQRVSKRRQRQIRELVIPPAWTEVWICPHADGHLQATGRDARGRKQYLYHPAWQEQANQLKFSKLRQFGRALPKLRRQVARHLSLPKLSQTKVVAAVVEMLDQTLVRVGNEEYARTNDSFGLTTLRDRHAKVKGPELRLRFQGKSGKEHEVGLRDRRVAKIVKQCQELPGQQLLQYRTERGRFRRLESADVNGYLRRVTGLPVTAKDFRTWKATALVLEVLLQHAAEALTATEAKRAISQAIREAAAALGNTITVCRKYYVHPQVVESFLDGSLATAWLPARSQNRLQPAERALLRLLGRKDRSA